MDLSYIWQGRQNYMAKAIVNLHVFVYYIAWHGIYNINTFCDHWCDSSQPLTDGNHQEICLQKKKRRIGEIK